MRKLLKLAHPALMGFVIAIAAFSYAMATTQAGSSVSAASVQSRAIGTTPGPIHFTNPTISGTNPFVFVCRDLGDAAAGYNFERYARADGGVPPYTFKSAPVGSTFDLAIVSNNTLTVLANGLVTTFGTGGVLGGALSSEIGVPVKTLLFNLKVTDSVGTGLHSATDCFQIRVVDPRRFAFAINALPDGATFESYLAKIEVVGGTAPYKFAVTGLQGTTAVKDLSDLGLSLNPVTGLIFGKPLLSGAYFLTVTAVDARGTFAQGRFDSNPFQIIALNIAANSIISSDSTSTSIVVKGSPGIAGKDSIKYTGMVNLRGKSPRSPTFGSLQLSIGGYSTPPIFLINGKSIKPKPIVKGAPVFTASISANGLVKIAITNESFASRGLIDGTKTRLAVGIRLGDAIASSEILTFTQKAAASGFILTYKLGSANLGGVFMLTSTTGKDAPANTGIKGDLWKTAFVVLPPTGGNLRTSTAAIDVGVSSTTTMTVLSGATSINGIAQDRLTRLSIAVTKGKGTFTSGILSSFLTGIPSAKDFVLQNAAVKPPDPNGTNFTLGVRLDTTPSFSGEGSIFIFPKASKSSGKWSSKVPR